MKPFLSLHAPCLLLLVGCGRDARCRRLRTSGRCEPSRWVCSPRTARARYAGEVRARYETDLAFRVAGRVQTPNGGGRHAGQGGAGDRHARPAATMRWRSTRGRRRSGWRPSRRPSWRSRICSALLSCARRTSFHRPSSNAGRRTAEAAQARVRQLRAEAARQGNQQAYTRLTAPHAGVVTALNLEAGQVVAARAAGGATGARRRTRGAHRRAGKRARRGAHGAERSRFGCGRRRA
ncbi:MAG: efflux RND transporter periplasmic adaptor subunit [Chromatiales bacterium]|nr:efflux RND transporter periplasmic adaptor subunit [Chromatiales bacterium]